MKKLIALVGLLWIVLMLGCSPADDAPSDGQTHAPVSEREPQTQSEPQPQTEASADEVTGHDVETETPIPISYRNDVLPIFQAKCISCHHQDNAVKVILTDIFDPELGMINRPNSWPRSSKPVLVVPGDPDASALMLKITETDLEPKVEGDPMPWNIPRLTSQELASLAGWIDAGAEDNQTYTTVVARIFGDGVSLGSRGGKCAYCHHSFDNAYEPDLVDTFDPETGAVNVASFYGGLRIAPGDALSSVVYLRSSPDEIPDSLRPLMPRHYERLTPEEIETVREWIAMGARND